MKLSRTREQRDAKRREKRRRLALGIHCFAWLPTYLHVPGQWVWLEPYWRRSIRDDVIRQGHPPRSRHG
jgi:hypothetical protein